MDYIPGLVGGAVGLGDGLISHPLGLDKYPYSHTLFRAAAFGLGIIGELAGFLSPEISYGLMTSSLALVTSRFPSTFASGPQALGYVAEHGMVAAAVPSPLHGAVGPALARIMPPPQAA